MFFYKIKWFLKGLDLLFRQGMFNNIKKSSN